MHLGAAWLPLLADKNNAYILMIAAILVMTIPMLLRIYRYQSRTRRKDAQQPPAATDPRGLRATAPDAIVRWEVQMQELARDSKAEIDSKMVALAQLIHDADRAAKRLEDAMARIPPEARQGAGKEPGPAGPRHSNSEALREEVCLLADYGFSAGDIASRLSTTVDEVELILRLRQKED